MIQPKSLPTVAILATGGTIAGKGASNTQMTDYQPGVIGVRQLIDAVPELKDYAHIQGVQTANIPGYEMHDEVWLKLADSINSLTASPDVDGIVITHGTDTIEETAYFLNLTVKSKKPVIVVGAMRPATAISADGPVNLLNAVRLAGSTEAQDQGVLVVLNDQINAARDVTKTNTTHLETFQSPDFGVLGYMINGKPRFYRQVVRKHTMNAEFRTAGLEKLPEVAIIYGHTAAGRFLIDAAIAAGVKGIVYAGTGNGNMLSAARQGLIDAVKQGIVVVRSSRTGSGIVTPTANYEQDGLLAADTLNPQKARILLMLALTITKDRQEIQRMFEEY